ncbi:hypothetical protein IAT38_002535 [Cryptococcus sp. DSM 104549]
MTARTMADIEPLLTLNTFHNLLPSDLFAHLLPTSSSPINLTPGNLLHILHALLALANRAWYRAMLADGEVEELIRGWAGRCAELPGEWGATTGPLMQVVQRMLEAAGDEQSQLRIIEWSCGPFDVLCEMHELKQLNPAYCEDVGRAYNLYRDTLSDVLMKSFVDTSEETPRNTEALGYYMSSPPKAKNAVEAASSPSSPSRITIRTTATFVKQEIISPIDHPAPTVATGAAAAPLHMAAERVERERAERDRAAPIRSGFIKRPSPLSIGTHATDTPDAAKDPSDSSPDEPRGEEKDDRVFSKPLGGADGQAPSDRLATPPPRTPSPQMGSIADKLTPTEEPISEPLTPAPAPAPAPSNKPTLLAPAAIVSPPRPWADGEGEMKSSTRASFATPASATPATLASPSPARQPTSSSSHPPPDRFIERTKQDIAKLCAKTVPGGGSVAAQMVRELMKGKGTPQSARAASQTAPRVAPRAAPQKTHQAAPQATPQAAPAAQAVQAKQAAKVVPAAQTTPAASVAQTPSPDNVAGKSAMKKVARVAGDGTTTRGVVWQDEVSGAGGVKRPLFICQEEEKRRTGEGAGEEGARVRKVSMGDRGCLLLSSIN